MEQIPQLAEKWDASPDARVYTFYLRKGVKFHDGTPFNAAAVKANFDRVRNPDNKLRRYTLYKVISQIDVIDDSTVRFTLSEPFGAMIATFAHPAGGINSPTAVQKYGKDYEQEPRGHGPVQVRRSGCPTTTSPWSRTPTTGTRPTRPRWTRSSSSRCPRTGRASPCSRRAMPSSSTPSRTSRPRSSRRTRTSAWRTPSPSTPSGWP